MISLRHILPSVATAAIGVTTTLTFAASPASAATFHTIFTLSGVGNSSISGEVVDTHEHGVPNFENETWQIRGATPGETYFPVITIGGCPIGEQTSPALPLAVLGWPTTANSAGNAATTLKVPRAGLSAYLQAVGIPPQELPSQVPAQLLLVPANDIANPAPFQPTADMVSAAVAATDCRLVPTD